MNDVGPITLESKKTLHSELPLHCYKCKLTTMHDITASFQGAFVNLNAVCRRCGKPSNEMVIDEEIEIVQPGIE